MTMQTFPNFFALNPIYINRSFVENKTGIGRNHRVWTAQFMMSKEIQQ